MSVKDMKQDEVGMALESFGASATEFGKKNRTALIGAVVGVAVVALAISGYRWMKQSGEAAAQTEFAAAAAMAEDIENPPSAPAGQEPAPPPTWAEVAVAFAKVAADHDGTRAGELAAYQAGIAQLRAGDAATAAATLGAFVEKHPNSWAAPHALAALATAAEQQADLAGAEAALVKLKDGDFTSYPPGVALAHLAEFYERHDRGSDAQKLWTTLAEDARFADTAAQGQAKSKVEQAKGG